ncbi:MAG: OsmC family protein [Anaerolineaceae bacterium]|nr:OsmC family protein [Anaerolineaceae bacterium]
MGSTVIRLGAEGLRTTVVADAHVYHVDEPLDAGGSDTAADPVKQLLGALGSCMAITARLYAQRKGWPLEGVEITLDIERRRGADYPGYGGDSSFVHEVSQQITLQGPLDESQRRRILEIAGRCPVHRIVESPAFFVDADKDP